jgi:PleD family two-component response regulator
MKILIAQYNKTLAKLIHDKISLHLKCEIDIVHSFKEAKEHTKTNQPLLALLDLYLPDADENEVLNHFLENSIPSIVISTEDDKEIYKNISSKNIIDYLLIQNIESINYLASLINRIKNNKKHNILVVDDSKVYRNLMANILRNQLFNVYTASSGEEALHHFQENQDIQIVLTDYHMPNMNGMELTLKLRKEFNKNRLAIIGISNDKDSSINFLKYGANDFIKKPFIKEELNCRVNNTIESLENIDKLYQYSHTDFLTQIPNRKYFFDNMNRFFKQEKIIIFL